MTLKLKFDASRKEPVTVDQVGSTVEELGASPDTDIGKPIRLGLLTLIIGFGGFLLWALFAPLESGVPIQGVVSVLSDRKSVQHFSGGIVDEINVEEGTAVKAGQILVKLNSTRARTDLEVVQGQYFSARAVQDRLMAEYSNQRTIKFNDDLLKHKADPRVAEIMNVQAALFATRRASQIREASVLKESGDALHMQLVGMRDLATDGYLPRNKMLDAERAYAEIRLRMMMQEHDYRKQVETMLGDTQKEASNLFDRLRAAQEELDRTEIKAPVDGVVIGLNIHTIGAVLPPGGHVLDIVPNGEPLIVEAMLPTHLIDQARADMKADLRFTAFNQFRTPVITGRVASVSADRQMDQSTHQPYYLIRVTVPPEELKRLGSNHAQAGMPVDVILKGQPRTFMSYLLKPLMDRLSSALKER